MTTIKTPSLDTVKVWAILAGLGVAGFLVYKAYRGAAAIGDSVRETVTGATDAVSTAADNLDSTLIHDPGAVVAGWIANARTSIRDTVFGAPSYPEASRVRDAIAIAPPIGTDIQVPLDGRTIGVASPDAIVLEMPTPMDETPLSPFQVGA